MRLLLSNSKQVGTKTGWKHGTNSNQLYKPEASLTSGEASPADKFSFCFPNSRVDPLSNLDRLFYTNLGVEAKGIGIVKTLSLSAFNDSTFRIGVRYIFSTLLGRVVEVLDVHVWIRFDT
jgi:hypothetical protein